MKIVEPRFFNLGFFYYISTIIINTIHTMKNSKENQIDENCQKAFEMLNDFPLKDKLFIINSFRNQGISWNTVSKDGEYYKNSEVEGFLFSTEDEAIFAEHLINFVGDKQFAIEKIFPIVLTLSGKQSPWSLTK